MGLRESLFNFDEHTYGENYRAHLLYQYQLYVEMADRISSRRQTANAFFVSISTLLLTFLGYIKSSSGQGENLLLIVVGFVGMVMCFIWYRLLRSYRELNSGKFRVIHEIERQLPITPYAAEWISLGEGKDSTRYLPFTHIETTVPWIIFSVFLIFLLLGLSSYSQRLLLQYGIKLISSCLHS